MCNHPLISEAIVVGDGRKYLAALITLDPEEMTHWAQRHNKLAEAEALAEDADLLAEIQAAVDQVNETGFARGRHPQVPGPRPRPDDGRRGADADA